MAGWTSEIIQDKKMSVLKAEKVWEAAQLPEAAHGSSRTARCSEPCPSFQICVGLCYVPGSGRGRE